MVSEHNPVTLNEVQSVQNIEHEVTLFRFNTVHTECVHLHVCMCTCVSVHEFMPCFMPSPLEYMHVYVKTLEICLTSLSPTRYNTPRSHTHTYAYTYSTYSISIPFSLPVLYQTAQPQELWFPFASSPFNPLF